jgi:hypothetical protein
MAIKDTKEGEILTLKIDNGDLKKFDEILKKWKFKDYQSFLRFAASLFILNEDHSISIKMNGQLTEIQPVADLLVKDNNDLSK